MIFKEGDTVMVNDHSSYSRLFHCLVGTIVSVSKYSRLPYLVLIDDVRYSFAGYELERVSDDAFKSPEPLIVGDIVLIKPGTPGLGTYRGHFGRIDRILSRTNLPYYVVVGDQASTFEFAELTKVGHYDGEL